MTALQAEHEWVVEHHKEVEKYAGRWVAILDQKIVSSGRNFQEAYRKATKFHPGKTPLVMYVLRRKEELMIV